MEEFLRLNYTLLTHSVEIIAAITGIICYRYYKHTNTKYFIWFLIYVVLIEFIGNYTSYVAEYEFLRGAREVFKGTKFQKNHWFFTLFWIIGSTIFYGLYFRKQLKNPMFKQIVKFGILVFGLFSLTYLLLNPKSLFAGKTIPIDVFGIIIILLTVIFYLVEMLHSDKILRFYKSINFYISVTLIIWYIIITPMSFYNIYFSKADWNFVILKYQIFLFANLFMYLMFSFALIYCSSQPFRTMEED